MTRAPLRKYSRAAFAEILPRRLSSNKAATSAITTIKEVHVIVFSLPLAFPMADRKPGRSKNLPVPEASNHSGCDGTFYAAAATLCDKLPTRRSGRHTPM
jgi:hypothetical protein